jgi:tetratricopeptide (TPR) repeat protein
VSKKYKYRAFISYSHTDERWAAWLHKALETYRVPKYLVDETTAFGPVPERIGPIFRDRDELSTATKLGDALTQALADSACQIVICSPNAARSRWTNEEILTYKRLGREDRIFCLIVDGEPGASQHPETADRECFPPALIYELDENGQLSDRRGEPIAADARKRKDNRQNAKLKLIAGMLGVGFDALKQREQQRHQRRMLALTAAAIGGMAITSTLAATAWFARIEAEAQRNRAQIEAETAKQTTRFMVDLFKVSDPSEALGNTITAKEILDKGALRIDSELEDQPAIQATLMDTMGTVYTSLGLYDAAVPLVSKAVQKRKALFGDEHVEVAQSAMHLGQVLTLTANFEQAEANLRGSLAVRRKLFGDASPEVAETATSLADVLSREGEFAAARPLIAEALAIRRALHSDAHPDVAESLEDLGLNHYDQGEYEQAVSYLRDAVLMQRQIHTDVPPPALAEAISNLGWAVLNVGELAEAESLFRESLEMKRRVFEDLHPELAFGLNNIAYVLELRGDLAGAEATYREALAMGTKRLGADHPENATMMSNIAFVLYAKDDTLAAIDQLRQALEMRRRVLASDHPDIAATATGLAYWLIREGAYEEASQLIDESLAVRRKVLGTEHAETAGTMTVKANLLIATRRYTEALEVAREAQRILKKSLPEGHWRIAAAQYAEGEALAGIGQFEMAEPLLLSSLTGLERAPIPRLADDGRRRIAAFYSEWGKPEEGEKYLAMQESVPGM